jgi:hypothetical protein
VAIQAGRAVVRRRPHACPLCHGRTCFIRWGFYRRTVRLWHGAAELLVQRYRCKDTGGTFHVKPAFCQRLAWYGADVVGYVLVQSLRQGKALDAVLSGVAKAGMELATSTARRWLRVFMDHADQYGGALVSQVRQQGGEWDPGASDCEALRPGEARRERGRLALDALDALYRAHHPRAGPAECGRMSEFWNWYLWKRFGVYLSRRDG